ncbi:MAG: hypothetical protein QNL61_03610 [Crocinitomicaceae bacterium]
MQYKLLISLFLFSISCSEPTKKESEFFENIENKEPEYKSIDEKIVRHIEGSLSIPGTEKYTYTIYKENLNSDDSLDYIITVNRLEFALQEAIISGNVAKRAEMGYMGNYNYYFYMDGLTKEISTAIAVPSGPYTELEVNFHHIKTEAYYDFTIDFRIRNSKFRRFYTVINQIPRQTFETKIFDGLGDATTEAFAVEFAPGSFSLAKDIIVYDAKMENVTINSPNEVYSINPKITATGKLNRKWFFSDPKNKYFTEK